MKFIDMTADGVLEALLRTSWQVALLVVAVLLVERVFSKQLSPRWRYGLWCIVLARAAFFPIAPLAAGDLSSPLAWSPSSIASVEPTAGQPDAGTPSASGNMPTAFPRSTPARAASKDVAPGALAAADTSGNSPRQPELFHPGGELQEGAHLLTGSLTNSAPSQTASSTASPWPDAKWALLLWALGAAVFLAYLVGAERSFRKRCRDLPGLTSGRTFDALATASQTAGLSTAPRILVAPFVSGPAVTGILKPTLIVPPGFGDELDDQSLNHVLLHETFHLRNGDVPANVGICVLRALFWFHPVVLFAATRLIASRESLRDWQALSASHTKQPSTYAKTLLDLASVPSKGECPPLTAPLFLPLLRRRPDLERRILMIARFNPTTHKSWTAGVLACASIGWLAFTAPSTAAPVEENSIEAAVATMPETTLEGLRVERMTKEADWHRTMRLALEQEVSVASQSGSTLAALEQVAEVVGINLTVMPDAADTMSIEHRFTFQGTAATVIDNLLELADLDLVWTLDHRSLIVGQSYQLPMALDLRLYDVSPLLNLGYQRDDLLALIYDMSTPDYRVWDHPGSSIDPIGDLLRIRSDYRSHERAKDLLDRILNLDPAAEKEATKSLFPELDKIIADVSFDDASSDEVFAWLAKVAGVPVGYDREEPLSEFNFSFDLKQVSMVDIMSLIANQGGVTLHESNGSIWFGSPQEIAPVLGIYDLSMFKEVSFLDEYPVIAIEEMVYDLVDLRGEQDNHFTAVLQINGRLFAKVSPTLHAQITELLSAMKNLAE